MKSRDASASKSLGKSFWLAATSRHRSNILTHNVFPLFCINKNVLPSKQRTNYTLYSVPKVQSGQSLLCPFSFPEIDHTQASIASLPTCSHAHRFQNTDCISKNEKQSEMNIKVHGVSKKTEQKHT